MSQYIFIYGTLRPGLAPDEVVRAVDTLRAVGEGSVAGVLYDLGEYPGAVADSAAKSRVFGTVYELPEDADVLWKLDDYEGFNPDAVAENLFVRDLLDVQMADGQDMRCWMYLYNLPPVGAQVVADGRYRTKPVG
jgi:gamma-glutamylcyclotransferase (GGCT)/AIG2-like uncharacterized protein YtfP